MLRPGYAFSNSPDEIRALLGRDAALSSRFETVKNDLRGACARFSDKPERLSGWGHNFVCPKCAAMLAFDPDMDFDAPHVFTCPHCGTQVSGGVYDAAWVYKYRYHYGVKLSESVALCAMLGDRDMLDFLIRLVDFYADHYAAFPVHGEHAGKGKIMPQSLCEAVLGIGFLRALAVCGDLIPDKKRAEWADKLFRPMAELLLPQANRIHNIPTWLMCCVGMIGLYCRDDGLLAAALDGEFGLRNQVALGFTADGLWHECSVGYHYYTAEALTYFLSFYALRAPDDPLFDRLAAFYAAPLMLSHDGWQLQSVNDGWYPLTLAKYADHILRAARIVPSPEFCRQLTLIREKTPDAISDALVLLYGTAPVSEEKPADDAPFAVWPSTNLAFVRQPFYVLLKSGVVEHSHMHCDYLSTVMPPFSDDLGTPGYGHPLTPGWYRQGVSHNAVCIDGRLPYEVHKSHVERLENGVRAVLDVEDWADSALTRAQRTLTSDGIIIHDAAEFESTEEHVYDWFFHSSGAFSCNGTLEPCAPLGTDNGYEQLANLRRVTDADPASPIWDKHYGCFFALWTMEDGRKLYLFVQPVPGLELYVADTPGNPADLPRHTLILRQRGNKALFDTAWRTELSNQT